MYFQNPSFLWALGVLLIPIIIHLFYFRRYRTIPFSNTKFLQDVREDRSTRNRLRNLLILLTRLAALAFLVFAFAKPFLGQKPKQGVKEGLYAIYLDNSFSMMAERDGFSVFDQTRANLLEWLKESEETARFIFITNAFDVENIRSLSKDEVLERMDRLGYSTAQRSLQDIADRARSLSAGNSAMRGLFLCSDFQRINGRPNADSSFVQYLLPNQPIDNNNVSIDSAYFERPVFLTGQRNRLVVELRNQHTQEARAGRLQLTGNKGVQAVRDYNMEPGATTFDTLSFVFSETGWNTLKLSINDAPLTFDDVYYLRVYVEPEIRVLSISNPSATPFIEAVFQEAEGVSFKQVAQDAVDYSSLSKNHFVVYAGYDDLPSGLGSALQEGMEQGAFDVLYIPGADVETPSVNRFFAACGAPLVEGVKTGAREIVTLHRNHPVLAGVFERYTASMRLPQLASTYSFNALPETRPVLSYGTGYGLFNHPVREGSLYVFNAPLSSTDKGFEDHALFAPLLYNMAALSVSGGQLQSYIQAETVFTVSTSPGEQATLEAPNKVSWIPTYRPTPGGKQAVLPGAELEAGFYTLKSADGEVLEQVALNYDRRESRLAYYSPDSLNAWVSESGGQLAMPSANAFTSGGFSQVNSGKPLWRYCLLFTLLFLALETLIIRLFRT